jgi:hypothetical protein
LLTFFGAGSQLRHHIVSEEAAQVCFLLFLVLVYPDSCTFPGLERHEFPGLDFLLPLGKGELFFAGLGLQFLCQLVEVRQLYPVLMDDVGR